MAGNLHLTQAFVAIPQEGFFSVAAMADWARRFDFTIAEVTQGDRGDPDSMQLRTATYCYKGRNFITASFRKNLTTFMWVRKLGVLK